MSVCYETGGWRALLAPNNEIIIITTETCARGNKDLLLGLALMMVVALQPETIKK